VRRKSAKAPVKPAMNVTPLVDVVLVLLIIFMIITPLMTKQFYVHLPKQEEKAVETPSDPGDQPLVLSVDAEGQLRLNDDPTPADQLVQRLRRVFAARNDHVLFFDAHDEAPYGPAVEALDKAREGGAVTIAILTRRPVEN
jgi:biopolymer transport protein ExbD/biopolymer transport protein TolR